MAAAATATDAGPPPRDVDRRNAWGSDSLSEMSARVNSANGYTDAGGCEAAVTEARRVCRVWSEEVQILNGPDRRTGV